MWDKEVLLPYSDAALMKFNMQGLVKDMEAEKISTKFIRIIFSCISKGSSSGFIKMKKMLLILVAHSVSNLRWVRKALSFGFFMY